MLMNGARAFDPDSYAESGRAHHRRFKIAAGVFGLLILLAIAAVAVLASSSPTPPATPPSSNG